MNLYTKMVVVLTSVGLLSGLLLSTVGYLTKDKIALNQQREIEDAIIKVVPGSKESEKVYEENGLIIYEGKNKKGEITGFAVYASGTGFQDIITLMYGTNTTMTKLNALTILDQKETPGLGAKITDEKSFLRFWKNRNVRNSLSLRKPPVDSPEELSPSEVNTITGATISSEKVLEIVNASLRRVNALKKEGKIGREG